MAFKLISRPDPAPRKFLVTDDEAISYGQALIFSSGRLTSAAAGGAVAAISLQDVAAGTNKTCKVILVGEEQEWEVGYTGSPAAGFVVGCNSADLASGALLLNAADVTGGPCSILEIDSTNAKCVVKFKNRQLT
jgi:hypothetical protein